jgi:transaldolase
VYGGSGSGGTGLKRRERDGLDSSTIGPVCTIRVCRPPRRWLKVQGEKMNISMDPGYLEWAGVAVLNKTYQPSQERGYRIRLLSEASAIINHMHWSEFIGGDVVISLPCKWQKRFNASDVTVETWISTPVDAKIIGELVKEISRLLARLQRAGSCGRGVRYLRTHGANFASVH